MQGQCATSAAKRPARRLQPKPRACMRRSSHVPLAAARRLVLRTRVARAAGAGRAASAQGAQAQLSSPQRADQHGSLPQHDAVYQARFIASAGIIQSVVLPYVGPAQAAAIGLRPPCDDICWLPANALLRLCAQESCSDVLHWLQLCLRLSSFHVHRSWLSGTVRTLEWHERNRGSASTPTKPSALPQCRHLMTW